MQRNQAEAKWDHQWGEKPISCKGKTIVIVGLGLLAEHLAQRCKLFGMTVIGVSGGRTGAVPHFDGVVPRADLAKVAGRADFLMLLVPYSKDTHHLVSRDVIAAMKPSAFLINLARGGVLDEDALIEHLKAGKISRRGGGCVLQANRCRQIIRSRPCRTSSSHRTSAAAADCFVEQTLTVVEPNLQAFVDGRLEGHAEYCGALRYGRSRDPLHARQEIAGLDPAIHVICASEMHLLTFDSVRGGALSWMRPGQARAMTAECMLRY